ncbi:MAG: sel1 repeat family protein, partial [Rhodospirillaceae bacterium]|nr:sel1 repeat family protein [Rhodospirillaceae bacterium]
VVSPCDQNNLGDIYYYGDGVEQDFTQAVKWFRLAADQDYPDAQHNLGEMYFNGEGVSRDYEQAHFWLSLAADEWGRIGTAAKEFRDQVASFLTPEQIERSLARVAAWKPSASP